MNHEDFIFKLGKSKQDKFNEEFTMLHDETVFQIVREAGPEAFSLYYALNSYTRGKTGVMAFPKNDTLCTLLNVNERTIRRWKQRLKDLDIIRVVPCYLPSGAQTSNIVLLNASYPDIPDGWDQYAAAGFIKHPGQLPVPKLIIENDTTQKAYKIRAVKSVRGRKPGRSNLSGAENQGGQIRPGQDNATDNYDLGGRANMTAPPHPITPDGTRANQGFLNPELKVVESYEEEVDRVAIYSVNYDISEYISSVTTHLFERILYPDEVHLIQSMIHSGIQEETIIQGIKESFRDFKPKYEGDRVKTLQYCSGRILQLHEVSQRPSVKLPAASSKKPKALTSTSDQRVIPAVQPGKYQTFYDRFSKRNTPSE